MEGENRPARGRARGRGHRPPPVEDLVLSSRSPSPTAPTDRPGDSGSYEQGPGPATQDGTLMSSAEGSVRGSMKQKGRAEWKVTRAKDYVVSKPADVCKSVPPGETKKILLLANYYKINPVESLDWSLYSITIQPEVDADGLIRKIIRTKKDMIGPHIRTGLQLFTTRMLASGELVFYVPIEFEGQQPVTYRVTLEHVRQVEESETIVEQFHNSAIRQMLRILEYQLMGRHYFDPEGRVGFTAYKLDLWPGFHNSIRQLENGTYLNVESVWKVVQTQTVLEIILEITKGEDGTTCERDVSRALEGMVVVTPHNKHTYKITSVDWASNPLTTFPRKDGSQISFVDYFQTRHNVTIRVMKQPLLIIEPNMRQRRIGFNEIKLLPELCYPCGMTDAIRGNFSLMKALAGCLHMKPTQRVRTMQNFANRLTRSAHVQDVMKSWGLLEATPAEVPGRVLNAEKLFFGNEQSVTPSEGDFTKQMKEIPLLTTVNLKKWGMVFTSGNGDGAQNLLDTMIFVARKLKFMISQPIMKRVGSARDYVRGVDQVYTELNGQPDMIMVILDSNTADYYIAVKKRCSIDYGILSQCILSKNTTAAKNRLMTIATKVVIQMNAKLGGEPWGVSNPVKSKNLMVLGYDVHHAGPKGGTSFAAMSATMKSFGSNFSCVTQLGAGVEVASVIADLFQRCLTAYKARTGNLPGWIIMYRDGVGEGQLSDVFNLELAALKSRIAATYTDTAPAQLCYVVVNKRITTRFFVKDEKDHKDPYKNPEPGVVVDNVVTRPERFDFFLVSQKGRAEGCVSPTYYNVLVDEMKLGPDKLQRFTYRMCHMYFNWTGTVSVPAPCQNAHKLAYLVGTALKNRPKESLNYLLHYL